MRRDRAIPPDLQLRPGGIQKHHIGVFLHPFEDNCIAIRADVKGEDVKVRSEVGKLLLSARIQVDEPEILVLNLD